MRENVGECEKLRANEGRAKGKTTEKMRAISENKRKSESERE